jgi:MscS family membrane protein
MRRHHFLVILFGLVGFTVTAVAQSEGMSEAATAQQANTTAAAAATAMGHGPTSPHLLEHMVDLALEAFDVQGSGNTTTHYVVAIIFLVVALLMRRVVTGVLFNVLRRVAGRTRTTLDDKLIPALEAPVGTLVLVFGVVCALKVLKLSELTDGALRAGETFAFSLVVLWLLLAALGAFLDYLAEVSTQRKLSVSAFMPWIKRTVVTLAFVFGILMIFQGLGYNVRAFLAGLGIGGLAFALAAQDTLANLFGAVVVAVDQPFRLGESVKIGAHEGTVEDIGIRSTKLRTGNHNLIVVPNKMAAAEAITNNSRYLRRKQEQVITLTYDTTPEQMEAIVAEIREIIEGEPEVDAKSVHAYFRDYSASSLDIWISYSTKGPDFAKFMQLRQRINLNIMRAVERNGLAFAFPTQTVVAASSDPKKPAPKDESAKS